MRPTRTQTLTEKGRELLERNLRGKCNAALRSANTIANKLNPLLESADVSDVSLVRRYKDELELCIIQIISTHDDFQAKFAGDLETLAQFSLWFQPRFEVLQKLFYFTRDWLAKNTKCDADDNVRPEDSVSQVASVEDNFTGRSSVHRSRSGSHSTRKSCASSSSIKSARIRESLKKVSLLAEANSLSKKQDLLRKELELSLEKESLELSTKLAIATAKEEVLLDFSVENSVVTTSQLDKKTSDAKFKMVTDHIGQAGVEFVHPTTDSVCPVKIEMDSCTRQASLPENSETRRVEFAERKVDFGRPNLNFSSGQTVVKSASTPVDGLVEKQDEDQVCSPLLVHNAAVSAAAGDLNTTDFSRYETRSRVSVSPDQVCMKSGSSNATHTFSTPVTMTHKLNPCIPAFVPQETRHFHKHNFDAASSAEINGAGRLTTHQHMPHKDFHSYMPVKHSYGHSSDAVVGHSGGHSGAGGYIAPDSQFGVVLDRLSDVLADSRNRLPEVVIPKFSGDPLDFASFVRSFDSRIASRTSDEGERLYYLEQFTVGTAREIVRSCMHMPLELAYQEARRRLERRFGDKFLLSQAYIRKLESWSAIRNDDVKRLDEFTTFLIGCSNAMTCSDAIRELDYPSSLRLVVSKLPSYLQERWTRLADKILYLEGDVVTFSRLVSFLEDETRIKLNPVFGKAVLGSLSHTKGPAKKSTSVSSSGKKSTSVAAVVKQETSVSGPNSGSPPCLFCSLQHPFERCRRFQKILHKAKISFLMQNKLCFDCLGKDHLKSQCSKKVTCDVCKGPHNTLLHRPAGKTNVEGQVGVASGGASSTGKTSVEGQSGVTSGGALPQKVSVSESVNVTGNSSHVPVTNAGIKTTHCHDTMPIVPVKLKLTCNDTEIYTHALLDSGSSDTLITEETMTRLGAGGKRVTINLTTVNGDSPSRCYAVSGLEVCGLKESSFVPLPVVYSQESLPVSRDQIPSRHDVDRWDYLSHIDIPSLDADIGILIGNNVPRAVEPWEVINSEGDGPYAVRTLLGWCVNGPLRGVAASLSDDKIPAVSVNRLQISCLEDQVQRYFDMDFSDHQIFSDEKALSVEDQQFLSLMEQQTTLHQGHYEICLPLRDSSVPFPNNRPLALQRMKSLEKKFRASDIFKRKYVSFVDDLFVKGHASEVSVDEVHRDDGFLWYLPHHGVIHPRKNKMRVVLDASARFAGVSLNDRLLPGPDLSSSLIGVLVRFRQERVAFMADLECMFYQVRVPVSQRDLLRFLWWPQGDVSKDLVECRMHTHIFGASSSPAVAKYALRKTASDNAENFSPEALMTVKRCFYVDDCLKSVSCVEEGIVLAEELRKLTQKGGFRLTQWVSNSRHVLDSIPASERAKNVKEVDLSCEELPSERALGVLWAVESDVFGFHVNVPEKPATRRGILSVVSSVYDPLGMAAPVTLNGKMIVQDLCRLKLGWDDCIPDDVSTRWQQWLQTLPCLNDFVISRCYVPEDFGVLFSVELHHFADACEFGYGCISYLRFTNQLGQVYCTFAFGKSRVAPLKQMTIPRMELVAAVLAARVDVQLRNELDFTLGDSHFWSDSTSVLGYVKNERARFNIFVANRVAVIRENTSPAQWHYVPSGLNPADDASRGLDGEAILQCDRWKNGPRFLWNSEEEWPVQPDCYGVNDNDPEVKVTICASRQRKTCDIISRILSFFSDWRRLLRFVAFLKRAVRDFRRSSQDGSVQLDGVRDSHVCVKDLDDAELIVIQWIQQLAFPDEIDKLESNERSSLPKGSRLASLNPIMVDGILRVGGRIRNAPVPEDLRYPAILPADSPVSTLLVQNIHEEVGHGGRQQVLSRLREKFWIIGGNALTRRVLKSCVFCRRNFGRPLQQKMADLPPDRVKPDQPPFTSTGVDYFGPIVVKRGRSLVKRYGVLFTCLASRAVHLEMAASLDIDAFINALRRFVARRGQVRVMRSDNGTNLVGGERELREAIQDWNTYRIETFLQQKNITWLFNAPGASHHGGSWERLIRSSRRIMVGLLKEQTLSDDGLATLLAEVEAILNGRPLTRCSSDPNDLSCLTPNHLLLLKCDQALPPGIFTESDNYVRRRWRQVQYLSDQFWKRWVREYLVLLQERQKWFFPSRNVQVDDVVLVVDSSAPRGSWVLGRVTEVYPDKNGLVRNVSIRTKSSTLVRPIAKLVMVLECDE